MAEGMKTPGVYVPERGELPDSVVEVASAVPAFIGYTQRVGRPTRISSLAEYHQRFGDAPEAVYGLAPNGPSGPVVPGLGEADDLYLVRTSPRYFLYHGLRSFFENGGGACYIVSVGSYEATPRARNLTDGLASLVAEPEPTLIVLPDAVLLRDTDCSAVQRAALRHCEELTNRFAILDVHGGYRPRSEEDPVAAFREAIGVDFLGRGAAYYPWIDTTVVARDEVSYRDLDEAGREALLHRVHRELAREDPGRVPSAGLDDGLLDTSPISRDVLDALRADLNRLPPSATMAGVYAQVDHMHDVWKAPANVSLVGVIRPTVSISDAEQQDLNLPPHGKSVNAIRSFVGEGTLVWGARTLDGHSLDWRYVNVRRTVTLLEESMKRASRAYLFEANDASTWATIKTMIRNFLTGIWKRGGLSGSSPDAALSVHCGLGETMTADDVLAGILRVTVLVAPTRPAEFIEITYQQRMEKA